MGWKLGYNPSAKFDTQAYLSSYADVIRNNPLIHYLTSGKKEHRSIYEVNENNVGLTAEFVEKVRNSAKGKKAILLFNHELTLTGAPRALMNMAVSMQKQGYYPVIISWKDGPMAEEIKESGIDAAIVPLHWGKTVQIAFRADHPSPVPMIITQCRISIKHGIGRVFESGNVVCGIICFGDIVVFLAVYISIMIHIVLCMSIILDSP